MLPENIIYLGFLINLFLSLWYVKTIVSGSTKPNLVSWLIWMLAPFVGTFLAVKAGAGLAALGIFMAGFGPLLVIIFSLWNKNAYWKINKLDIVCGVLAFSALVLYVITRNLGISILFAIISDALAAIPTIIKSWEFPETESSSTYLGGILNNILALFIIKNWIFSVYSFNVYLILINIIIVFCIYRRKIFKSF